MVTWEILGKKAVETINSTGKRHFNFAANALRDGEFAEPTMTAPFSKTAPSLPATSLLRYST